MVPIYQAYWIIISVLGGAIYFQEIKTFTPTQAVFFVIGISTTIAGVILLSQRKIAPTVTRQKSTASEKSVSVTESFQGIRRPSQAISLPIVEESNDDDSEFQGHADFSECSTTAAEDKEAHASLRDSDEDNSDYPAEDNETNQVSRQAIDNYLDMSAGTCISEILEGLGFNQVNQAPFYVRRPVNQRSSRRTRDDIELGISSTTRDEAYEIPKRRSITFTAFQRSQKQDESRHQQTDT